MGYLTLNAVLLVYTLYSRLCERDCVIGRCEYEVVLTVLCWVRDDDNLFDFIDTPTQVGSVYCRYRGWCVSCQKPVQGNREMEDVNNVEHFSNNVLWTVCTIMTDILQVMQRSRVYTEYVRTM